MVSGTRRVGTTWQMDLRGGRTVGCTPVMDVPVHPKWGLLGHPRTIGFFATEVSTEFIPRADYLKTSRTERPTLGAWTSMTMVNALFPTASTRICSM